MNKRLTTMIRFGMLLATSMALHFTGLAQTANWTNVLGGDWNVAANWDLDFTGVNVVPAEGTNASITAAGAVTVGYNAQMAAASFGSLAVDGGATLNINAAGFNQNLGGGATAPLTLGSGVVNVGAGGVWTATNGGTVTINSGGILNVAGNGYLAPVALTPPLTINAGGTVNVTTGGKLTVANGGANTVTGNLNVTDGSLVISNSQVLTVSPGATVSVTNGTFLQANSASSGSVVVGVNNNNTTTIFQMQGGTVTLDTLLDIRGRKTGFLMNGGTLNCRGGTSLHETSTDDINRLVINGGDARLGDFELHRTTSAGGFILSNGVVNTTSFRVGRNASQVFATIFGGTFTNTGAFTVCDRTNGAVANDRRPRLQIRGGTMVSTDAAGIIVANQANLLVGGPASSLAGIVDINAGTLIAEGITLVKDNTLTNAHAVLNLSGTGIVYLGSVGLIGNVGPINSSYSIAMSGGTLAAKNNFAVNANITLTGSTGTFQAADPGGNPFNITANGIISSSGILTKTGAGVLILATNNTYNGSTTINAGTLALGANGAISNSAAVTVAAGATLDVSATTGFNRTSLQSVGGNGTVVGNVTAFNNATLIPGASVGRLTFSGNLTQAGGVINSFELTAATNDTINVTGTLNVSGGTNSISVVALGGSLPGGTYKLFGYGSLIGGITNFTLSGAPGSLTNDTVNKTISLITTGVRGSTNIVWVGGPGNNWDVLSSVNWQKQSDASPEVFVNGDSVLFNATGAANPSLTVVGAVQPSSVTVGAATDYTFGGNGSIGGAGSLTKTNSGTLRITTTNGYTGGTTIAGGMVEVTTLANGGVSSGIGASPNVAANLVLDGATLRYLGTSVGTDRSATVGAAGATVDVASNATILSVSGTVSGGGLVKVGPGQLTLVAANTFTNGMTINGGTLQLNNNTAAGVGGGLTNNGSTLRLNTAITVDNVVNFNGACTVLLSSVGAGNVVLRGAWSGSGNVDVNFLTQDTNQTFTMGGNGGNGGGYQWDFSGTVNFGTNTGFARWNNNDNLVSFGSSNATFNLGTSNLILFQRNGGTTTHIGALIGGPNTQLSGRRGSAPSGTTTYLIGGNNLSTTFEGSIVNGLNPAAIDKVGTGTLKLTGVSSYTGITTIEAGTLEVDGTLGNTALTVVGGSLTGNGILGGPVIVNFGATLSPGTSVGLLTISNSLQLDSGSTNVFQLDKSNGTNDSIAGLTSVSYSGTLDVSNIAGTLAAGDKFTLFASSGGYGGVFETINLPPLDAGLTWDTNSLTIDGSIQVVGPNPALNFVNNGGSSLTFTWSGSFKLQSQTNGVNVGLSTNWSDYPGGGTSGITVPVDPAQGSVFFRLATP